MQYIYYICSNSNTVQNFNSVVNGISYFAGKVIDEMEEKCNSLLNNYTEHLYGKYNRKNWHSKINKKYRIMLIFLRLMQISSNALTIEKIPLEMPDLNL